MTRVTPNKATRDSAARDKATRDTAAQDTASMRLALPKGRNMKVATAALRAAGFSLAGFDPGGRKLRMHLAEDDLEVVLLKDWDVALYVEYGIADCGVVGSDVLDEVGADLLVPVRFLEGGSKLSLIGPEGAMPAPGSHVRLATKYPQSAKRMLAERAWSAEVLELKGSVELGPLLDLAEVALDIVQTGRTLAENGLVELEPVTDVAPCLVAGRAAYQRHRGTINEMIRRLEAIGAVA